MKKKKEKTLLPTLISDNIRLNVIYQLWLNFALFPAQREHMCQPAPFSAKPAFASPGVPSVHLERIENRQLS